MSEQTVAGVVLIAVPILFNAGFALLAQRFGYPDILRRPTHEVLERFRGCPDGVSTFESREGADYAFCSMDCRRAFEADPKALTGD